MPTSKLTISEWITDDLRTPSVLTIGDMLIESADKWPKKEALVYSFQPEIGDIRMTYKELNDRTSNIAKGFLEAGYTSGDAIAIWGPNHPEWILAEYGLAKAGLKLITLNPLYKKLELEYALNSSQAVAIIHADQIGANIVRPQIEEVKEQVQSIDLFRYRDAILISIKRFKDGFYLNCFFKIFRSFKYNITPKTRTIDA